MVEDKQVCRTGDQDIHLIRKGSLPGELGRLFLFAKVHEACYPEIRIGTLKIVSFLPWGKKGVNGVREG